MITFIKSQLALIAGSVVDFLVTILLVNVFHCWYVAGNFAGNMLGATVLFLLSRNWAFSAADKKISPQVIRFVLVWTGSFALSAIGIYCFTHYLHLYYVFSKLVTSVLLGVSYHYLLQKKFVFI